MKNKSSNPAITAFPKADNAYPVPKVDRAFVSLAAAVLEEPEELILAALLASEGRQRRLQAA